MKKKQLKTLKLISKFNLINWVTLFVLFVSLVLNELLIKENNIKYIIYMILIFLVIILLFKKSKYWNIFNTYIKESKVEFKNISWPNRKESFQTTISILLIVFLVSLLIWIIDSIVTYFISKIV